MLQDSRYTTLLLQVLQDAEREHKTFVGTAHVLEAMLKTDCRAGEILKKHGITLEMMQNEK